VRSCHVEELAAGATDCYLAGRSFLHFCKNPSLWGVVIWSRPAEDDVAPLARSLPLELGEPALPHGSIVDASRLSGVDAQAFSLLNAYVRSRFEELARAVLRLALVRPSGVEGAVVAGFFEVMPRPYPVRVFESSEAALAWLAEEPKVTVPPGFAHELDELYMELSATTPLVAALCAQIEQNLGAPNIAEVARALALSERTLQRRLKEAGTTFHAEVGRARLRVAERLLLDTDAPLTRIAFDVGCASLQHFSALFRKAKGESPSAWRARKRLPEKS
jgi:AraC-like DNA-binding protein